MQSHTPGPWAIKAARGGKPEWMFLSIEDTALGYRGDVATCSPAENINGITRKECLANAHLIAAAPDMLDVLKRLNGWFDTDAEILAAMLPAERTDHERQHGIIRDAIAKAEGRS